MPQPKKPLTANTVLDQLLSDGYIEHVTWMGRDGLHLSERGLFAVAILYGFLSREQKENIPQFDFGGIEVPKTKA